jgi:prepilin-type N-terminal cleavage/methylation domain-containing protein
VSTRVRAGYTLVEVLVAMTIFSVFAGAIATAVITMQRAYTSQTTSVRSQEALRVAPLTLTTVLRTARANPFDRDDLSFIDADPFGDGLFSAIRVVSDFNPPNGETDDPLEDILVFVEADTLFVSWQADADPVATAFPVRNLRFEYFDENGNTLTDPEEAADARRVRFILESPRPDGLGRNEVIESWVLIRNRPE